MKNITEHKVIAQRKFKLIEITDINGVITYVAKNKDKESINLKYMTLTTRKSTRKGSEVTITFYSKELK
jgi:hypothetical protein